MNEFWHLPEELEPPIGKNVWTTTRPWSAVPCIRADSWNGKTWRNHGSTGKVFWAYPITRRTDNNEQ